MTVEASPTCRTLLLRTTYRCDSCHCEPSGPNIRKTRLDLEFASCYSTFPALGNMHEQQTINTHAVLQESGASDESAVVHATGEGSKSSVSTSASISARRLCTPYFIPRITLVTLKTRFVFAC